MPETNSKEQRRSLFVCCCHNRCQRQTRRQMSRSRTDSALQEKQKKIYSNEICNYGIMKRNKRRGKSFSVLRENENSFPGCGLNIFRMDVKARAAARLILAKHNLLSSAEALHQQRKKFRANFKSFEKRFLITAEFRVKNDS